MRNIVIDKSKGEVARDGFDKLYDALHNGEFGVWYYGGFVTTTDDLPNDRNNPTTINEIKSKANDRREKYGDFTGFKIIEPDSDGFKELIEARKRGEFAVWSLGGFVNTTDDLPSNYESMDYQLLVNEMKIKGIERKKILDGYGEFYKEIKNMVDDDIKVELIDNETKKKM